MRKHYSHVMSTLAVFIALGGGAYAVTFVKRAKLADNSLRLGGVPARSYRQDFFGGFNTHPAKVRSQATPLISGRLFNSGHNRAGFLASSDVSVANPGPDPVDLTLLLLLNGHREPGSFVTTISPGASLSVPAIFAEDFKSCKAPCRLNLGNNEVQLLGEASNKGELVVQSSSLFALRPIVIPPGRSSCCTTSTGLASDRPRGR